MLQVDAYLQPFPASYRSQVLQYPPNVRHHDKHGKVDLHPILSFLLIDLVFQSLQKSLREGSDQIADDKVIELRVHDGCHRNEAIVWMSRFIRRLESYHCAATENTPVRFDESRCYPDI